MSFQLHSRLGVLTVSLLSCVGCAVGDGDIRQSNEGYWLTPVYTSERWEWPNELAEPYLARIEAGEVRLWSSVCDPSYTRQKVRDFLSDEGHDLILSDTYQENGEMYVNTPDWGVETYKLVPVKGKLSPLEERKTLRSFEQDNGAFLCPNGTVIFPENLFKSFQFEVESKGEMELRMLPTNSSEYSLFQHFDPDKGPYEAVIIPNDPSLARSELIGYSKGRLLAMPSGNISISPDGTTAILPAAGEVQDSFWTIEGLKAELYPRAFRTTFELELRDCEIGWFDPDNLVTWSQDASETTEINLYVDVNPWDFTPECEAMEKRLNGERIREITLPIFLKAGE